MSSSFRVSRFWLFAAVGLAVLATWLAARAERNPVPDYRAATFPPPVLPTRGVERKTAAPAVGDAAERYVERRQRGMAPREIRWILEDFQQAGLGKDTLQPPLEILLTGQPDSTTKASLEKRAIGIVTQQRRWYLAALVDGLSLDAEQQRQARRHSEELLSRAVADFRKDWMEIEEVRDPSDYSPVAGILAYSGFFNPANWLDDGAVAPASFCKLNESQLAIGARDPNERPGVEEEEETGPDRVPASEALARVNAVFPLTAEQSFGADGGSLLKDLQRLHPAQLRLLLLADLALEAKVQAQLQEAGE